MGEWLEKRMDEIADFNPRESLPKGTIAKKIAMDKLQPFCRDVPSFEMEAFSGGTKFRNGDTIMARITPCLENGKTAMVDVLDDNEVGFGSTEYIVFRAKEGNDPDFVYYLVTSPEVREPAIRSMVGSSGRQRVQTDVVQGLKVRVPDLEGQRAIAGMLKILDEKIAANRRVNENLSDQIQAIYSNEFDPTTHTPSGVLADICTYSSDKIPVSELSVSTYYSTENMQPNKMGSVDATSLPSITQTTGCHKGDVLISNIRPYFKKIVYVTDDSCGCSTDVLCFVPKEDRYSAFLFGTLYMDRFFDYMVAGSKGTKMPRGDKQQIMNYPIVLPDKESLDLFNGLIVPMLDQIATNRIESSRLAALRDALLPKLMSGELDVSSTDL